MKYISKKISLFFFTLLFLCIAVNQAFAGVALGTTRVVLFSDKKQESFYVMGDGNESYLIQSWIEDMNDKKSTDFIITPPLFLLKGKNENILRVIKNIETLPMDRESLYWINVKAVPSVKKSELSGNVLQFAITNRIKLFYRPEGLKMTLDDAYKSLKMVEKNGRLSISNNSPYFITVVELYAGNKKLDNVMIPPFGSNYVSISKNYKGNVSYKTINDYGAQTEAITVKL